MTVWFSNTYDLGITLNTDCVLNGERESELVSKLLVLKFHVLYIGSTYLDTVIHSNIDCIFNGGRVS